MFRALRLAVAAAVLVVAASPATAHAFTLIQTTKVTVTPTAGYPTSTFKLNGHTSPCGNGPFTYTFYFDTNIYLLWNTSVGACNASAYDTGLSPSLAPPSGLNTVGAHQIILNFSDAIGGSGSVTTTYTINNPPPPPPKPSPSRPPPPPPSPVRQSPPSTQPSTSPSTAASPNCPVGAVTAGCPSPSANACPAAMLPSAGTGGWADNLIAAAMVGAALPIAGLAMFGPQTLLAAAYRRRRFLTLFGLSAMAVLALNCTFPTTASNPQTTPAAAVTPSAAATPSSCSA